MLTHSAPATGVSPASLAPIPALLRSPRRVWVFLLLLFLSVHFVALFSPALLDDADATHANAAVHMDESGDWVTLYVNGVRYLEKPPLPYWLVALDYHLFGENVFATHLPMTLAVLASAILGWVWARRAFDERAAFYTALGLLTTVGIFLFTRWFIPESLLCFLLALALWAFLTALEDARPNRLYITYAALALALLAKGLIAPLFFAAAALPYLLITGEWRRWRELRLGTGLLLFLAIGAPWHVLAAVRNPDFGHPVGNVPSAGHVHGFLYFYFVNEHVLRFLGRRYPHDYNKQPGWVFWVAHLAWLFPWCLFFPAAVRRGWSHRRELTRALRAVRLASAPAGSAARQEQFRARTTLLLALYAIFILLFFSVSTNQEYYTFPAYFALLLLTAGSLSLQEAPAAATMPTGGLAMQAIRNPLLQAAHWLLAIIGVTASAILGWGLWASRGLPYVPDVGTLLAHRGVGDYSLSMSHFFDLTGPSLAALRLPAALAAAVLFAGPLLALVLRRRERHLEATTTVAVTMALFLIAAHVAFVRFEPVLSSRSMASIIQSTGKPGNLLLVYDDQSNASSITFYTHRRALLVNGRSSSMVWGSFYPDAPHIFLTDADLVTMWQQARITGQQIFLFVPAEDDAHVRSLLGPSPPYMLKELSDRTLYSNQPG